MNSKKNSLKSFNPCSYGSSVLTEKVLDIIADMLVKFQSLFLWIFRSYNIIIG